MVKYAIENKQVMFLLTCSMYEDNESNEFSESWLSCMNYEKLSENKPENAILASACPGVYLERIQFYYLRFTIF